MRIIYAIEPVTQNAFRVILGCDAYQELLIDYLIGRGLGVAITEEAEKPIRSAQEEAGVNRLMDEFHNYLSSQVLN